VALDATMADILTCYYRPKPGGLFTRYLRAMEALLAAGHRVHYLALTPFPINHPRCLFHRFPWPVTRSDSLLFWICFSLMAPFQLMWIAYRHRVHIAFCFDLAYAFCLQPLRVTGVTTPTCFVRGDGLAVLEARKSPPWLIRLASWMEGAALIKCRVVGPGSHLIDEILARHPKLQLRQVSILPNDLPKPNHRPRQTLSGPLRAAMVGPLVSLKNHGFILDMLGDANTESVALTIFGTGPEEANLKRKINQYKMRDRTSLAGWVAANDIWKQVDLLLAPSLHEGMPNAVLEALANGIPVLASDIPGHRMILPELFCLPLSDPERWRQTLAELMRDAQGRLSAMYESQMQFASRLRFDWDARVVDLIVQG
jgi:glycosyltransferase involved in cell wall biosynthesis